MHSDSCLTCYLRWGLTCVSLYFVSYFYRVKMDQPNTALLKSLLLRAWRERWSDMKWSIHVKKLISQPTGGSDDSQLAGSYCFRLTILTFYGLMTDKQFSNSSHQPWQLPLPLPCRMSSTETYWAYYYWVLSPFKIIQSCLTTSTLLFPLWCYANSWLLSDLLLQQALLGSSPNNLVLSYLRHAISTQVLPHTHCHTNRYFLQKPVLNLFHNTCSVQSHLQSSTNRTIFLLYFSSDDKLCYSYKEYR